MDKTNWAEAQGLEKDYWENRLNDKPVSSESEYRFQLLLRLSSHISSEHVICDVGSGPNGGILSLIDLDCLKIAVDPIFKYIPISKSTSRKFCAIESVGEFLGLKNSSIDVIYSVNSLDHSSSPHKILENFNRILKPDGKLILMVHVVSPLQKTIFVIFLNIRSKIKNAFFISVSKRLIDFISYKLFGLAVGTDSYLHPFYFTIKDFRALIKRAGFFPELCMLDISHFGFKKEIFLRIIKLEK